jgi:hypothetical protein
MCDAIYFSYEQLLACQLCETFVSELISCPLVNEVKSSTH